MLRRDWSLSAFETSLGARWSTFCAMVNAGGGGLSYVERDSGKVRRDGSGVDADRIVGGARQSGGLIV